MLPHSFFETPPVIEQNYNRRCFSNKDHAGMQFHAFGQDKPFSKQYTFY